MTGMPAWSVAASDGQIWDIVAFLEAMPDMSPQAYQRMRAQTAPSLPGPDPRRGG